MKRESILIAILLTSFCLTFDAFSQSVQNPVIFSLIDDLQSTDIKTRMDATKAVTKFYYNDSRVYEVIEQQLAKGFLLDKGSKHRDEMAWLCKALAASGDPKHETFLNEIADKSSSTTIKKYARLSASQISQNATRNALINNNSYNNRTLSYEENHIMKMLLSGDSMLIRDAAKTIYRGNFDQKTIYNTIDTQVHEMIPQIGSSQLQTDTIAWLCKALGHSHDPSYAATLELLAANDRSPSLQIYAKRALDDLIEN